MHGRAPSHRDRLPGRLTAVLVLLGLSTFINYIDRGNLSLAAPLLKQELNLSASQLGLLLSAFFWTYACLQPASGWLVDRINVNWVLAAGFCLWSCATVATGFVHAFVTLFLFRLLLGVGESITFPSCSKIIALNFPEQHRGLANSATSAGLILGPGFGMLFGGLLMASFGWRPFFIVLGLISLLWLVPWIRYMPAAPIPPPEANSGSPSFADFVRLRSAWGTCFGLFSFNYVNYFLITWLPYYLVRQRHFSMDKMAQIGGAAYLMGACSATFAGWLSDRYIAAGQTPTRVRKVFTSGGLALGGILLGLFALTGPALSVILIVLGVIFLGFCSSNIWAITQTLAGPHAAGRWTGFQNFVGNFAGVVGPALTGFVLQWTGQFYWAFAIMTTVALAGTASWIFLIGRIEPVAWRGALRASSVSG